METALTSPPNEKVQRVTHGSIKDADLSLSGDAPFIYCDHIGAFGLFAGMPHVTLEAIRHLTVGGNLTVDRVVVAHLRLPLPTLIALGEAIERLKLMAQPAASAEKN